MRSLELLLLAWTAYILIGVPLCSRALPDRPEREAVVDRGVGGRV